MSRIVCLADYPWMHLLLLKNCYYDRHIHAFDNVPVDAPKMVPDEYTSFSVDNSYTINVKEGYIFYVESKTYKKLQSRNAKIATNPILILDKRIKELEEDIENMIQSSIRRKQDHKQLKQIPLHLIDVESESPAFYAELYKHDAINLAKRLNILSRAKDLWLAILILPIPIRQEFLLAGYLVDGSVKVCYPSFWYEE